MYDKLRTSIRLPEPEPLWTVYETSTYLALSISTLYRMSSEGRGPVPLKISGRLRYRPNDVKRWASEQSKGGR